MEVANLQHGGGVAEDEINGALQPCRVGKGMPEVEWSYLNSIVATIFGFLCIAVTAFDFLQLLSSVFVVVEKSFVLKLMVYNSDLWLYTENR